MYNKVKVFHLIWKHFEKLENIERYIHIAIYHFNIVEFVWMDWSKSDQTVETYVFFWIPCQCSITTNVRYSNYFFWQFTWIPTHKFITSSFLLESLHKSNHLFIVFMLCHQTRVIYNIKSNYSPLNMQIHTPTTAY